MKNINKELTRIANTHLGIETLETRKDNSLDFHDCSAGLAAGVNNVQSLVGKIVNNDGMALTTLLSKYSIGPAKHDGNFTFSAKMSDGKTAIVTTEPVDEEYNEIQILSVYILN